MNIYIFLTLVETGEAIGFQYLRFEISHVIEVAKALHAKSNKFRNVTVKEKTNNAYGVPNEEGQFKILWDGET